MALVWSTSDQGPPEDVLPHPLVVDTADVDIDGTRVVVTLPQSVSAPFTPGTNRASLAEQQQVLDSIRIAPLPSPEATVTTSPPG